MKMSYKIEHVLTQYRSLVGKLSTILCIVTVYSVF